MAPHIEQSLPPFSPGAISKSSSQSSVESPDQNKSSPELTTRHETIQDYANHVLEFLANASNETLASCLVGLGAVTYFILGRFGLVLIGAVGGIVLHATWEYHGKPDDTARTTELKRRREVGLDVVNRVLAWRQSKANGQDNEASADTSLNFSYQQLSDYSGFRPATRAALEDVTAAIIRDYVKWWYTPLLPSDESFPTSCRQVLVRFLLNFSSHLSRKRPADTFIDFLTNSSSVMIVFMNELSSALMASGAHDTECSGALYRYLEEKPDSHLSNVLDVEQQQRKLKAVADDILHSFLDSSAYKCEPVKAFLREVLAGLILDMTIKSCSRPDFINGWIIYLLEEADSEIIDIIDAGVGGATANGATRSSDKLDSKTEETGVNVTQGVPRDLSKAPMEHRRNVSKAEDAMEEAIQEAKRLTELIAAEEAKRNQSAETNTGSKILESTDEKSSSATTPSGPTPNSSASDLGASNLILEDHAPSPQLTTVEPAAISAFTSFDQILPPNHTTALQHEVATPPAPPPLTLHNATVSMFDDAQPSEKGTIRSKPQSEYMIQIEPATMQHPGWMIARRYPDFETLHEVLRRISVVSGVPAFAQKHSSLPGWKNRTKAALRNDLEQYLRDALYFDRLAESEGMKRFLEKDHWPDGSVGSANKGGFGFPSPAAFESMGKGMLDVLASAPKGAAGGGKAILGGFTGVVGGLGSIGQKKPGSISPGRPSSSSVSRSNTHPYMGESYHSRGDSVKASESQDGVRKAYTFNETNGVSSTNSLSNESIDNDTVPLSHAAAPHVPPPDNPLRIHFPDSSETDLAEVDQLRMNLPPPPSEIPDEYSTFRGAPRSPKPTHDDPPSTSPPNDLPTTESLPPSSATAENTPIRPQRVEAEPLTEPETRVAVELLFALINELYTLSSAWNIRRTLLNAAKSYLLRPGNPSLTSIQQLLQSSLDKNTSDEGIAAHLTKLRENSLPTEEELKSWPSPPTEEEKEEQRRKARKLLVEKGMPAALKSVMGAAASGEALGRVFDSLQVESVARGFMFAIILQGIRAVVQ